MFGWGESHPEVFALYELSASNSEDLTHHQDVGGVLRSRIPLKRGRFSYIIDPKDKKGLGRTKGVMTHDNCFRQARDERVPHPHGYEPRAVIVKHMQDHVVNAVQPHGALDYDIELCTHAGRKEVCTEWGDEF